MEGQFQPALLDVDTVASMLSLSPASIYRLSDGGKMPHKLKLGGSVRWRKDEIQAWIASGCKPVRSCKRVTHG